MGVVDPAATKSLGTNTAVGEFRPVVTLYTLMSAERWVRAHTHV
jgi:hypothetical protein